MHLQVSLTFDVSATTSLTDLEEAILTQGRQSMCEALRQAIKWWEQHQRRCPACGREDEWSAHVPQKEAQESNGPLKAMRSKR